MYAASDLPFVSSMIPVTTYADIEGVLQSRDFAQGVHDESGPFSADTLITLHGPRHTSRRRLEGPLFHREALLVYEVRDLRPVIGSTLAALLGHPGHADAVRADLVDLMDRLLHRIAAGTSGIDGVEEDPAVARFLSYAHTFGAGHQVEWWRSDHEEVLRSAEADRERFRAEFYEPSRQRRQRLVDAHREGRLAREELPKDLLTTLLLAEQPDWDDDLPLREIIFYIVAATQTTAHAIPHLFRHLHEWVRQNPERAARLADDEFLRRAAYESLRLHTPHPAFVRVAVRDTTLRSGRAVRNGERVALMYGEANRQPELFGADPDEFDPERTVAPSVQPWGLTFGAGTHSCIGRPLATGVPTRASGTPGNTGTLVSIMRALYDAGATMDPQQPPARWGVSHHDSYERFPIVLRNPAAVT